MSQCNLPTFFLPFYCYLFASLSPHFFTSVVHGFSVFARIVLGRYPILPKYPETGASAQALVTAVHIYYFFSVRASRSLCLIGLWVFIAKFCNYTQKIYCEFSSIIV